MALVDQLDAQMRTHENRPWNKPSGPPTMATNKPPSRHPKVQLVNPFLVRHAGLYLRGYVEGTTVRRVRPSMVVPVESIVAALASYMGEPVAIVMSERRSRYLAWPRQNAMLLAKIYCAASFPQIGKRFGDRDHTTILLGVRAATDRLLHGDVPTEHCVASLMSLAGVQPSRLDAYLERSRTGLPGIVRCLSTPYT